MLMRQSIQKEFVDTIFSELAKHAKGPGKIYVTGGITAVLLGIRQSTIDIDLKLYPEPKGIFESIREVKEELNINVELASPDLFIPPIPGWEERSIYITTHNGIEFFHYDLYSQALAKIERGHQRDVADVSALVKKGLIEKDNLIDMFSLIEAELIRYPAIAPETFRKKVEEFVGCL